jgi:hypothetical protein
MSIEKKLLSLIGNSKEEIDDIQEFDVQLPACIAAYNGSTLYL